MYAAVFLFCLLSFFLPRTPATVLLDFGPASKAPPGSPLSTATLTNVPVKTVPDRFILCYSSRQDKVDRKSPFVLYGEDDSPWLAFSLWWSVNEVVLWAEVWKSN